MFENVDIHIHLRTTEAYLYYKLTYESKGSGELINASYRLCETLKVMRQCAEIQLRDAEI